MMLILIVVLVALLASWIFCQGLALAAKEAEKISEAWEILEEKKRELDPIEAHFSSDESY